MLFFNFCLFCLFNPFKRVVFGLWQFLTTESPLKLIKNDFYLILRALFISSITFILTFWSFRKKGLIRKIRLISKFMTSQTGLQTITIHVLPNISQSKGNRTIKCGQLIEYSQIKIKFSSKIMQKMRQGDRFQISFCLLKFYMR